MQGDELLFELHGPDGHVWRLYLDGRAEGFPEGTLTNNHAARWWHSQVGTQKRDEVLAGRLEGLRAAAQSANVYQSK